MMKWGLAFLAVALVVVACGPKPVEPEIIPPGTTVISGVEFAITQQDTANGALVATGTVKNTGTVPIAVPWYVGADFYGDGGYTVRLGGSYTEILTPLEANQSTFWTIRFTSPNVDVYQFPVFFVSNLKAYYPAPR